jgi:hypothetical protein
MRRWAGEMRQHAHIETKAITTPSLQLPRHESDNVGTSHVDADFSFSFRGWLLISRSLRRHAHSDGSHTSLETDLGSEGHPTDAATKPRKLDRLPQPLPSPGLTPAQQKKPSSQHAAATSPPQAVPKLPVPPLVPPKRFAFGLGDFFMLTTRTRRTNTSRSEDTNLTSEAACSTTRSVSSVSSDELRSINELIRQSSARGSGEVLRERRQSNTDITPRVIKPQRKSRQQREAAAEAKQINELIASKAIERTRLGRVNVSAQQLRAAVSSPSVAEKQIYDLPASRWSKSPRSGVPAPIPSCASPHDSAVNHQNRSILVDDAPKSTFESSRPPSGRTSRRLSMAGNGAEGDELIHPPQVLGPEVSPTYRVRGTARATRRFQLLLQMRHAKNGGSHQTRIVRSV